MIVRAAAYFFCKPIEILPNSVNISKLSHRTVYCPTQMTTFFNVFKILMMPKFWSQQNLFVEPLFHFCCW